MKVNYTQFPGVVLKIAAAGATGTRAQLAGSSPLQAEAICPRWSVQQNK